MASADILRAARARIEDPKNWTERAIARDDAGHEVRGDHPDACRWCALGALEAEGASIIDGLEKVLLQQQCRALFEGASVPVVNDRAGHAAILRVYDAAIAAAEAEAGR